MPAMKHSRKPSSTGKGLTTARKPRNSWDYKQKLALRLLLVDFELTPSKAVTVFNYIFAEHLNARGFLSGLAPGTLSSQFQESKKPNASVEWKSICSDATDPEEIAKRDALRDTIGHVVNSHGFDLGSQNAAPVQQQVSAELASALTTPKRKRSESRARSVIVFDENDISQSESKRSCRPTAIGTVVIYSAEQRAAREDLQTTMLTPPTTPRSRSRSSSRQRPDATVLHKLPSGAEIWLTLREHREMPTTLTPIADTKAHPYVPLLFRYSTADCQSPLTENGFIAGRFSTTIVPPPEPPTLEAFAWSCASQHLDRDKKVASPFISTSNNLVWIIRLALKEKKAGAKGGLISVIDPRMLNKNSVFHAQPFQRELCRMRPFSKGAWMYEGLHEFMVWAKIRKEAIVTTFPIDMLFDLASGNEEVGALLRLQQIGMPGKGYNTTILPALKAQQMPLGRETVKALARVSKALRLDVSTAQGLGSVVTDIVKGYGIVLESKSAEEWREAASLFCAEIHKGSSSVHPADIISIKYAFLDGCRWATGDFNARQKPKHMRTMLNRAAKIGLESPHHILMSELDTARSTLNACERQQQGVLQSCARLTILVEPHEEDDEIVVSPTRGGKRIASVPFFDSDDDIEIFDDEEDESITYDFDDEV